LQHTGPVIVFFFSSFSNIKSHFKEKVEKEENIKSFTIAKKKAKQILMRFLETKRANGLKGP
jgi:hypothetical protein